MKKATLLSAAVIAYCILQTAYSFSQGTAINNSGSAADQSAILDVSSASQGLLIPRLTEAQKNIIPNPATSLMIFQTDGAVPGYYYNAGTPGAKNWVYLGNDNLGNHTATDSLNMSMNKIVNIATCTYNYDAANKLYVDNSVAAGGGGGGVVIPTAISSESASAYTIKDAVRYCDSLTEGGNTDWRLPSFDEYSFFFGSAGASTNFLWSRTYTQPMDFATNQNYVTVNLNDGKWRNGGVNRFYFPQRYVSGNTTNTSWTTVATFNPLTVGNAFILTAMRWYANTNTSGNTASFRLKYNFPDGSFYYSDVTTWTYNYGDIMNIATIPILNEMTCYSSIEVQIISVAGTNSKSSNLYISGYEISLGQIDGTTLFTRCVR